MEGEKFKFADNLTKDYQTKEEQLENLRGSIDYELKGKLYIIDFGTSKHIFGQPEKDDYTLTIGGNVIRFISDDSSVRMLRSREPGKRGQTPFVF